MFTRSSIFAMVAMLPLATLAASSAQASPQSKSSPKIVGVLSWMYLKWDQSDAPYTKIRRSIESELKKGVAPETLIHRYDNPQKFLDTKLTFGYLVTSYERARRAKFSFQSMKALPDGHVINPGPMDRLQRATIEQAFPHNAEFARIAFLWWCNSNGYSHLYPVAKRLVARFPNDFDLKWWAFQSAIYGERKPNAQLLLKWANDLQHQRPHAMGLGVLKPMVYYTTWENTRSAADEKRATDGFRHFLAIAPANAPQRQSAEFRLSMIPIMKKSWALQAAKQKHVGNG